MIFGNYFTVKALNFLKHFNQTAKHEEEKSNHSYSSAKGRGLTRTRLDLGLWLKHCPSLGPYLKLNQVQPQDQLELGPLFG